MAKKNKKDDTFGGKQNTNGFAQNPQNINRKGRPPVSLRRSLNALLATGGSIVVPPANILDYDEEKGVTLRLPTDESLSMRIIQIAMSAKPATAVNAFREISRVLGESDDQPKKFRNRKPKKD